LTLAHIASEFHCRPSDFLRDLPETSKFQLDAAAAVRLWEERKIEIEREKEKPGVLYL